MNRRMKSINGIREGEEGREVEEDYNIEEEEDEEKVVKKMCRKRRKKR